MPPRFNVKEIPNLLEENKAWIIKQLHQLHPALSLPTTIVLNSLNETWLVHYLQSTTKLQIITRPSNELILVGDVSNQEACRELLIDWLKDKAKRFLMARIQRLSVETGLVFGRLSIRDQQTRWGSCTFNKTISLNYKLIFLPEILIRHILLHELCHTIHMNHSRQFWNLVAKFDSEWQTHRRVMRSANQFLPEWVNA